MHLAAVMLVISYCTFGVCISAYVYMYVLMHVHVCGVYDCACMRVVCVSVHVLVFYVCMICLCI